MKQMKGGQAKESRKERRERRNEMKAVHERVVRIVIPCLLGFCAIVVAFVYLNSRPRAISP